MLLLLDIPGRLHLWVRGCNVAVDDDDDEDDGFISYFVDDCCSFVCLFVCLFVSSHLTVRFLIILSLF